jgi:hypothetical protein
MDKEQHQHGMARHGMGKSDLENQFTIFKDLDYP